MAAPALLVDSENLDTVVVSVSEVGCRNDTDCRNKTDDNLTHNDEEVEDKAQTFKKDRLEYEDWLRSMNEAVEAAGGF